MSQQYGMRHNAVLQGKETSQEQAVVGSRVEFYLLDAAQTTADPLGYISNLPALCPRNLVYKQLICNSKYVYKGNIMQTNDVFT